MHFPLNLANISLWLAFTAIIFRITSEIISPYYRKTAIIIEKSRLRKVAFIVMLIFMFTFFIQIFQIMISL